MTVHVHDKEEALYSFEKTKEEADLKKFSLFKQGEGFPTVGSTQCNCLQFGADDGYNCF